MTQQTYYGPTRLDDGDEDVPVDTEAVTEVAAAESESATLAEIEVAPPELAAAHDEPAVEVAGEALAESDPDADAGGRHRSSRKPWAAMTILVVLVSMSLLLAIAAGYLKWWIGSAEASRLAGIESVRAATDGTIKMLSYRPDTVDQDLAAARDWLTGHLKDSYGSLTHDVVAPGSKQKQISAIAAVPAVALVSASANHATVLVFVDQTITVGNDAPTSTASRVRVTLDKIAGRWLIAGFDPI